MVKVIFYPPIAELVRSVEHNIALTNTMNIMEFMEFLKTVPELKECFQRIADYGVEDYLHEIIVIVNDNLIERETCIIKDGAVVKFILPLAGGWR